jgi:hypothetical protein
MANTDFLTIDEIVYYVSFDIAYQHNINIIQTPHETITNNKGNIIDKCILFLYLCDTNLSHTDNYIVGIDTNNDYKIDQFLALSDGIYYDLLIGISFTELPQYMIIIEKIHLQYVLKSI